MKGIVYAATIAVTLSIPTGGHAMSETRIGNGVAPEATTDPLIIIYRVSGVAGTGGANSGTATVFHCTNIGLVEENVRIRVFNAAGALFGEQTFALASKATKVAKTQETPLYPNDVLLTVGFQVLAGHAAIFATANSVICTAMSVNGAGAAPNGIDLHLVRYNAIPATVE